MTNIPTLPDMSSGYKLHDIVLTHQDVLDQLNRLNTDKSCGSDNCHPCVLKEVKDGLIVPLYCILKPGAHWPNASAHA